MTVPTRALHKREYGYQETCRYDARSNRKAPKGFSPPNCMRGAEMPPLARGGERAAAMYSLLGSAKLNDVDPESGVPGLKCASG